MEHSLALKRNNLINVKTSMDHKGITYERSQSLKVNYCRILSVNIIRETEYGEGEKLSG